jgi:hypothetical protein
VKLPRTAVRDVFLAELGFECRWVLSSWARLQELISQGDDKLVADPLERSIQRRACVDEVLIHLVRIDRLLRPKRGQDTPDSFQVRIDAAEELLKVPGLRLEENPDFVAARHAVEHANENLPRFMAENEARSVGERKALGPFSIGPEAGPSVKHNFIPLRWYNTLTGECGVLDFRFSLQKLVEEVRQLKFVLPAPEVTPHLTPINIPEPEMDRPLV